MFGRRNIVIRFWCADAHKNGFNPLRLPQYATRILQLIQLVSLFAHEKLVGAAADIHKGHSETGSTLAIDEPPDNGVSGISMRYFYIGGSY